MANKSSTAVAHTSAPTELLDDVRESARAGQHAANLALVDFRKAVDDAIPDAVLPLRKKIVDAAIELADKLVAAQYQFQRGLVRSVDRALNKPEDGQN